MKTTDLFKFNRSSKRINESLVKMFGKKLNLESFDTMKLEDARNKLRTQIHTARTTSGFNETLENEALSKAQWMHDAIVAELMDREEHIVDTRVQEDAGIDKQELMAILKRFDEDMLEIGGYGDPDYNKILAALNQGDVESAIDEIWSNYADQDGGELRDMDNYIEDLEDQFKDLVGGSDDEGGETDDNYALASAGFGSDEDYGDFPESLELESAPPTDKGERMVKHIKKGYAGDGKLTDKEKGIAYATAWKQHNKEKNESIETTGEDMRNLREGEIQQASAIVTAKTMVDRVGRWIEELSGMENDTLLQLGDSIRDEMGQEQAKAFIEAVAPAIQQALETLKGTRDTLSTGVRSLASGEAPTDMLGAEPGMGGDEELGGEAEPDMMNTGGADEMGPPEDEFGAAEPAAGGLGDAGREQRESINRSGRLLKVLAG
jgi:hypothetical protein